MFCSNCNSPDVRKLSLVYESGLSFLNTTTTGAGFGGAFAVGGAQTKGTQMTATSAKAAPPQKRSNNTAVGFLVISGLLGLAWHFWFIATALALLSIIGTNKYNKEQWPPLYAAWDRQYMCGRCGAIMVPSLQAPKLAHAAPQSVETIDQQQLPG